MSEVAIIFEKIDISGDYWLYKPVEIVEGKLDKESGKFIAKYNFEYFALDSEIALIGKEDRFFGYNEKIVQLKRTYDTVDAEKAIKLYFDSITKLIYVGTYDNEGNIRVFTMSKELFEEKLKDCDKGVISFNEVQTEKKNLPESSFGMHEIEKVKKIEMENSNIAAKEEVVIPNTNVIIKEQKNIDVAKICDAVNKSVINQEEAVDILTSTIAMNYIVENPEEHANIMLTGPTGCGKTQIIKSIAKEIDVPFVITGMQSITQEGYVGQSIDILLAKVYNASNKDIKVAQRAILALDEIDKKASPKNNDVAGRAVLNSLLKVLEGSVVDVNIGTDRAPHYIQFDTSHLTIISVGAFAGLKKHNNIGFARDNQQQLQNDKEAFFDFGIPEEYLGRQGMFATVNQLFSDDYFDILYKSSNSPLLLKTELLKKLSVALKYDESYARSIADKTVFLKAGARGLKQAINESLKYAIIKIQKEKTFSELIVSADTVENPRQFILK